MMKFIPILFLFFSNFLFAAGFCTDYENVAEDTITYAAAGGIPDNLEDCEFAPDGYEVTIYKFGMCTQAPTAPTGAAAMDTTNCITIFESDAGTAFNLAVGVELDLAGEEKPANGTYTHAYVIMANTFGITHSQRFGGAPATMGGVAGGNGAVCISSANDVGGTTQYHASNEQTLAALGQDYVTCGAAPGTAEKITEVLDTFGCDDPTDKTTCDFTAQAPTANGQMDAYLTKEAGTLVSDNVLSDQNNDADRLVARLAWTTPVVITDTTSEADIQFTVNRGTSARLYPPGNGTLFDIFSFGSGPFSVNIVVQ